MTPPTGSTGFDAADWTSVVNEVLAEIGLAENANTYFDELTSVGESTLLHKTTTFAAVAAQLGLQVPPRPPKPRSSPVRSSRPC